MIHSAQTKLASRLAQHSQDLDSSRQEKIEPAAHLDPGPDGYNIYGRMGHSLALTSVPLNTISILKRTSDNEISDESEMALTKARSLLARYRTAQLNQNPNNGCDDNGGAESARDEKLECPCAPVVCVSIVVSAFDEAITKLLKSGKNEAAAQAMSDLGDVMWHSGQSKSAGRWWRRVLSTVAGIQAPPSGWRKVLESSRSTLTEFGVWGCLLAALSAVKLARYVF